ncbi:MAG: transposase [Thermodesulfobacteriota bacterium]|nr:transposase [Thermodesulfobacteriota bacterium]
MPRIARMIVKGENIVYHVISRTALDGYVIGDIEKDSLLKLIKRMSSVYFAEVMGFCLMGNHFHLVVRMHTEECCSDEEIRKRFRLYYGDTKQELSDEQILCFREKWANISEYMREIKQNFSRFYNKLHNRKGFFWSDRFKSVIVESGETLVNCLAYIDLNPIRAGICERPEEYHWCSLGYHVQADNEGNFLSLDFGLKEFDGNTDDERLMKYREYVYEKGSLSHIERERGNGFEMTGIDRFRFRTRYFTDSGVIGDKAFVRRHYQQFKHHFTSKHEKAPKGIKGLDGVYSMKRLSEKI